MAVTAFDPRLGLREQLACWHEVTSAAAGHDDPGHPAPPASVHFAELAALRPDGRVRHWLACADGTPVGLAELFLSDRENLAWGFARVTVHPAHRRAGHGSALRAAAIIPSAVGSGLAPRRMTSTSGSLIVRIAAFWGGRG